MFRSDPSYNVVGFTAAQIPFISGRMYPKELSGSLYPKGIRIYDESELPRLVKSMNVGVCVMSYSDLQYVDVMEKASIANANGSDFWLVAPERTMIKSSKPVISVCGVRTGVGKSQTSRYISLWLREHGVKAAIIRHPMPYGILKEQSVEIFKDLKDLDRYKTTVEEREDYEPHIVNGFWVYAGVDYGEVLGRAEKDADVILWDGGNNDASFVKPDMSIVVADPLRAGDELNYYPGETVARLADVIIINKANSAQKSDIDRVARNLEGINKSARMVMADSIIRVDNASNIRGKRVLVVEDGPTITHGGMKFGAGTVAAKEYGAKEIVNAKRYAVGSIKDTFMKYPRLSDELPAVGYSPKQIRDLQDTINSADCDSVISATPIDLRKVIVVNKPIVRVTYELKPRGKTLDVALERFLKKELK